MPDGRSCLKCGKEPVVHIRYSGAHLCKEHFCEFFLKRVKKEIRAQELLRKDGTIAVALSGGKDSLVALKVLKDIIREHRGIDVKAVLIDEGIAGYRPESIDIAKKHCEEWDVDLTIVPFLELVGHTLDEVVERIKEPSPCALCGVFRRYGLNDAAKDMGAVKIVTGHNLDDLAQSVIMNVLGGDLDKLLRLGPHTRVIEGFIPRAFPLRTIPEREILLYALLNGITIHTKECPYSVTATRGRYRDVLSRLEMDSPGTRHSLINLHNQLRARLVETEGSIEMPICPDCSEPASGGTCKKCQYLKLLENAWPDNKTP